MSGLSGRDTHEELRRDEMAGFFKFVLYLGVVAGLAGFALPYFADHPAAANLPPGSKDYLAYGGLALIVIGLVGRSATRKEEVEWK